MTFEVRKGDTTVRSVWTTSVRNAFRKQAGWAKLQEAKAAAEKHWTERVWYRHNQRWLQASREGAEASKSGSLKDEREWGKKCFEDLDQRRMGRPVTRTWSTDFLLREGSDGKMSKKLVHTVATAEEVAPGNDRHFSVRTADGEVWLQGNSRVHTV
jgi:hypothetical protein